MGEVSDRYLKSFHLLSRWRKVFTGRVLGTRRETDPQAQGYNDLFESVMFLRAEVSGLTALLIDKRVFTPDEVQEAFGKEADHLCKTFEKKFPGIKAKEHGLDIDVAEYAKTTHGWPK